MLSDTGKVIAYIRVGELRPDTANPNRMSDAELDALTRSIQEFGFVDPIIARLEDNMVIGGHHRLLAARRLGFETVPVVLVDVSLEQARLLGLSLNKIHGDFDKELLARLLADLDAIPEVDLSLVGFDEKELRTLLRSLGARERRERPETFDLAAAIEEAEALPATAKPGDVWLLGENRLVCGDSTDPALVAKVMAGRKAQMAFTDPPYNVDYGNHGGAGKKKRTIANDAMSTETWEAFVHGWAEQLLINVDGALYVCMSTKEWPSVSRALEEHGGHWSDTLIWAKDRFVLGRADYQRQYEPIWYGWREGAKHHWCGDRDQGDILHIQRPASSELHPTMKPIELVERPINNSSAAGDVVLDLFLGAGSTLIAAERTGRVYYGAELEPHYCDIVVARWESFSGEKARLADG